MRQPPTAFQKMSCIVGVLTRGAGFGHIRLAFTKKVKVGIGVPFTAAKSRRPRRSRGFFHALVRLFSGDRAGGAARLAGAVPVRQLPFRPSTRLASCGRVQPLHGGHHG